MKTYTFDNTNPYWNDDLSINDRYNEFFLRSMQNYYNDKLQCYGHITLKEVLVRLGFPVDDSVSDDLGWDLENDNDDHYVDFGIEKGSGKGVFNLNFNIRD